MSAAPASCAGGVAIRVFHSLWMHRIVLLNQFLGCLGSSQSDFPTPEPMGWPNHDPIFLGDVFFYLGG